MNQVYDAQLLIEELKAQRNQANDMLALAGARIMALQKENEGLQAKVAELEKKG